MLLLLLRLWWPMLPGVTPRHATLVLVLVLVMVMVIEMVMAMAMAMVMVMVMVIDNDSSGPFVDQHFDQYPVL